jgi:homopolymeric O-antigen transport system permease protein
LPRRIPGTHFARNLIERRTLILQLVKRDFQQRYVGSAAGWLWGLVHPLVLFASYYFIFGICLKGTPGPNEATTNYPMFLFCGMLPWLLFLETVQRSSVSLVEQANLITKTVFPAEIVPVSIFLSSGITNLLALVLAIAGAVVFLGYVSPLLAALPVFMLLLGMFAIGIGWIAAALQVYLRDTAQVLSVILTLWFWATPIFINEETLAKAGPWAVTLVKMNPLTYFVRGYREAILGRRIPLLLHWGAIAAAVAIVVFVCGGLFFRYMKRGFADVL